MEINNSLEQDISEEFLKEEIDRLNAESEEIIQNDISEKNREEVSKGIDKFLEGGSSSPIRDKLLKVMVSGFIITTMGSSLIGCSEIPSTYINNVNSNIPPQTEIYQPSTGIDLSDNCEYYDPTAVSYFKNVDDNIPLQTEISQNKDETNFSENKEYYKQNVATYPENITFHDIGLLENLNPEKIEKIEKIIETTEESQILLVPVRSDYFYNENLFPQIYSLPAGITVEIKDIYYFRDNNEIIHRFSILPNVMGPKCIPIISLDNGHYEEGKYIIDGKDYIENKTFTVLANYSYLVGENEIYPNKILNILTEFWNLSKKQEEQGKFIKGQEYSFIDLINLENKGIYTEGFTSSRSIVKGGGVCAGATLMSNLLYELGNKNNIPWDNTVTERWTHSSMYFLGPFGANDFVTDATVQLSSTSDGNNFNFKWIQPEDGYIKIDVTIIPNLVPIEDTEKSGIGGKSDVMFLISLSFVKEDPGNQSDKLEEIKSAYLNYRNSNHEDINPLLSAGNFETKINWNDPVYKGLIEYIYPEERIEYFKDEMENDPMLSNLRLLQGEVQDIIDENPGLSGTNLISHLKDVNETELNEPEINKTKTSWYESFSEEKKGTVNEALNTLSYTRNSIQCVGFVMFLSKLEYEGVNFQYIGGAHSFSHPFIVEDNDGDYKVDYIPARTATELIPFELFTNKYATVASNRYGGITYGSENMKIDEYEVGDLFVRTDVGGMNTLSYITESGEKKEISFQTGHVGAIIGKKIVNDQVILLVADSNRKDDGKIRIFEVTEHNFYEIFGRRDVKKYIIRAASKE